MQPLSFHMACHMHSDAGGRLFIQFALAGLNALITDQQQLSSGRWWSAAVRRPAWHVGLRGKSLVEWIVSRCPPSPPILIRNCNLPLIVRSTVGVSLASTAGRHSVCQSLPGPSVLTQGSTILHMLNLVCFSSCSKSLWNYSLVRSVECHGYWDPLCWV